MLKLIGGQAPLSVKDPVNVQIVRLLIAKGAKVNARLVGGYTAPIQAAEIGNTGVAQALIDAGANVKLATETGLTALIAAASAGDLALVQLLLAKGADINAKDERNRTALSAAEDGGHEDVADLLRRLGASNEAGSPIGCLGRAGRPWIRADTTAFQFRTFSKGQGAPGFSADQCHSRQGSWRIDELLRDGASPNARDGSGTPAMIVALTTGEEAKLGLGSSEAGRALGTSCWLRGRTRIAGIRMVRRRYCSPPRAPLTTR